MSRNNIPLSPILDGLLELHHTHSIDYLLVVRQKNVLLTHTMGFSSIQSDQVMELLDSGKGGILDIKPVLQTMKILELKNGSAEAIEHQYKDLLTCITQNICKRISKEWIKVIEPNKQAHFPYKAFNDSKPPWWPHEVNHIEPDHLDKPGRISLMIQILRNLEFSWKSLRDSVMHIKFRHKHTDRLLQEVFYIALLDRAKRGLNHPYYCREYLELIDELTITALHNEVVQFPVSNLAASRNKGREEGLLMVSQIQDDMINLVSFDLEAVHRTPEKGRKKRKRSNSEEEKELQEVFPKRYTVPIEELLSEDGPMPSTSLVITSETAQSHEDWSQGHLAMDYSESLYDDMNLKN